MIGRMNSFRHLVAAVVVSVALFSACSSDSSAEQPLVTAPYLHGLSCSILSADDLEAIVGGTVAPEAYSSGLDTCTYAISGTTKTGPARNYDSIKVFFDYGYEQFEDVHDVKPDTEQVADIGLAAWYREGNVNVKLGDGRGREDVGILVQLTVNGSFDDDDVSADGRAMVKAETIALAKLVVAAVE